MNYGSVRMQQVERILRIVAEVRECEPHERRLHLIRGLLEIVGGRFATVLNVSDFRAGGRGRPSDIVIAGRDEALGRLFSLYHSEGAGVNPVLARFMAMPRSDDSPVQVVTRSELVDDTDWYRTPFVAEHLRAADVDDGICAVRYRAAPGLVRGFAVARAWGDRRFEPEDAALVHVFKTAADDLLDDDAPGWPQTQRPLTPRETQVLKLLLGGQNEKQFAESLGLSVHTIHQYTKGVFRAFGVSGRAELMAKFIPTHHAWSVSRPGAAPRPSATLLPETREAAQARGLARPR